MPSLREGYLLINLTQEDILACMGYAADRERQTLLIQA